MVRVCEHVRKCLLEFTKVSAVLIVQETGQLNMFVELLDAHLHASEGVSE